MSQKWFDDQKSKNLKDIFTHLNLTLIFSDIENFKDIFTHLSLHKNHTIPAGGIVWNLILI